MSKIAHVLAALAALVYFGLAVVSGFDTLKEGISNMGFFGFLLLISLSFIAYMIRFWRWNLLLGYSLPLKEHLLIYFGGFSLTMTPGKAGEAIRSLYLKDWGVPYSTSVSTFVTERFYDLAATLLFVCLGAFSFPIARGIAAVALPLILLLFFLFRFRLDRHLTKFISKKVDTEEFHRTSKRQLSPKNFLIGLSLGLLAWFLEGLSLYFLLQMLGEKIPLLNAVFAHALALLVGALTFLPGGVLGAEASLLEVLTSFGIPLSTAATATLLIRLFTLWFSIILGFCALPFIKKQRQLDLESH